MFTNGREAIMSMSYCTYKILIKIVYLYKHKRNITLVFVQVYDFNENFICTI